MKKIPEWFELTAGDVKPVEPKRHFSKIALLSAPLLIAGVTVVFAQSNDAEAPTTSTNSTSSTKSEMVQTISASIDVPTKAQSANFQNKSNSNVTGTSNSQSGIQNPMAAGVPNPDEDEHKKFGDRHERRERPHHDDNDHDEDDFDDDDFEEDDF
jgi:hypothetical protein